MSVSQSATPTMSNYTWEKIPCLLKCEALRRTKRFLLRYICSPVTNQGSFRRRLRSDWGGGRSCHSPSSLRITLPIRPLPRELPSSIRRQDRSSWFLPYCGSSSCDSPLESALINGAALPIYDLLPAC